MRTATLIATLLVACSAAAQHVDSDAHPDKVYIPPWGTCKIYSDGRVEGCEALGIASVDDLPRCDTDALIEAVEYLLTTQIEPLSGVTFPVCTPCTCGGSASACYQHLADQERQREKRLAEIRDLVKRCKGEE